MELVNSLPHSALSSFFGPFSSCFLSTQYPYANVRPISIFHWPLLPNTLKEALESEVEIKKCNSVGFTDSNVNGGTTTRSSSLTLWGRNKGCFILDNSGSSGKSFYFEKEVYIK